MQISLHHLGIIALLAGACGPSSGNYTDAGPQGTPDAPMAQPECTQEGETRCGGTTTFQSCQGGVWVTSQTCSAQQVCSNPLGCVDCFPATNLCVGNSIHTCGPDGRVGAEVQACASPLQCSGGTCVDLCAEAATNRSYLGCEYYAVDLDNALQIDDLATAAACETGTKVNVDVCVRPADPDPDAPTHEGQCEADGSCPGGTSTCEQNREVCAYNAHGSPFAIVVSNPQTFSVDVTVSIKDGTSHSVTVPAGGVQKILPQMHGFADQSTNHTSLEAKAYKIVSTAPIVAYQFNPLDNADVFSNDGSLLLPRTTFDTKYYAMLWATLNGRYPGPPPFGAPPSVPFNDWHGYVTIVAWEDDTQIMVTPSGDIKVGASLAGVNSGVATAYTLNAFDVLTLQGGNTVARPSQDLTGTLVEATNGKSFGVFAGHEAITIRAEGAVGYADHIEEMMFPTSTWGSDYAIARSKKRRNENDWIRVMAQEAGTTVSFNPSPAMGTCSTLGPGQFCEVQIAVDTEISGNGKPIMVGHYLASTITAGFPPIIPGEGNGDPSLALGVPIEQFRGDYAFLVPAEYDENHISVVAPVAGMVTLDGNDITSQLASFGSGSHKAGRIAVSPGAHKLVCPGGCGIEVYGYSDAVSYLFAGGLDLKQIVVD